MTSKHAHLGTTALKRRRSTSPDESFPPTPNINRQISDNASPEKPAAKRMKVFSEEPHADAQLKAQLNYVVCSESTTDIVKLVCGDYYCLGCLDKYVSVSLGLGDTDAKDPPTFPPRCCKQPITVEIIREVISSELVELYRERQRQEFSRCALYYAERGCMVAIETSDIQGNQGHCQACNRDTCKLCRLAWHGSAACPIDKGREAALKLAKDKGWQICASCGNVIELDTGCYHIT